VGFAFGLRVFVAKLGQNVFGGREGKTVDLVIEKVI